MFINKKTITTKGNKNICNFYIYMICNRDFGSIRKEHDKGNLLVTGNLRKRALRPPPLYAPGGDRPPFNLGIYIYNLYRKKRIRIDWIEMSLLQNCVFFY